MRFERLNIEKKPEKKMKKVKRIAQQCNSKVCAQQAILYISSSQKVKLRNHWFPPQNRFFKSQNIFNMRIKLVTDSSYQYQCASKFLKRITRKCICCRCTADCFTFCSIFQPKSKETFFQGRRMIYLLSKLKISREKVISCGIFLY